MTGKISSPKFLFLAFALFSVAFHFAALPFFPLHCKKCTNFGGKRAAIRQIKVELIKLVLSTSNHTSFCVQQKLWMGDRHELCKPSQVLPYIVPNMSC